MSFNNDFFKDFDRDFKKTRRKFGVLALAIFLFYVAFWASLIVILVLVLKHFGIL